MTFQAVAHDRVLPVDGILIINPRDFIERRENIERQLRSLGLTYEFIHTYDACDLDPATVQRHFTVPYENPGNQSCAMKHLAALRLVVERQWRRALILEDDVILAPDFVQGSAMRSPNHRPSGILTCCSSGAVEIFTRPKACGCQDNGCTGPRRGDLRIPTSWGPIPQGFGWNGWSSMG